jgi:hypothetical protein
LNKNLSAQTECPECRRQKDRPRRACLELINRVQGARGASFAVKGPRKAKETFRMIRKAARSMLHISSSMEPSPPYHYSRTTTRSWHRRGPEGFARECCTHPFERSTRRRHSPFCERTKSASAKRAKSASRPFGRGRQFRAAMCFSEKSSKFKTLCRRATSATSILFPLSQHVNSKVSAKARGASQAEQRHRAHGKCDAISC